MDRGHKVTEILSKTGLQLLMIRASTGKNTLTKYVEPSVHAVPYFLHCDHAVSQDNGILHKQDKLA